MIGTAVVWRLIWLQVCGLQVSILLPLLLVQEWHEDVSTKELASTSFFLCTSL